MVTLHPWLNALGWRLVQVFFFCLFVYELDLYTWLQDMFLSCVCVCVRVCGCKRVLSASATLECSHIEGHWQVASSSPHYGNFGVTVFTCQLLLHCVVSWCLWLWCTYSVLTVSEQRRIKALALGHRGQAKVPWWPVLCSNRPLTL